MNDLAAIEQEILSITLGESRFKHGEERVVERPLPDNLDEVLRQARSRRPDLHDPATGAPYEYEKIDDTRFRLCARFDLERDEHHEVFWNHAAGRHCFEFDLLRSRS